MKRSEPKARDIGRRAETPGRQKAPDRLKTPDVIIEVAEDLWGMRGLDAVSLREISAAAGLANPASVQYHFGNKDSLIRAIFAARLPAIDHQRKEMMLAAHADGRAQDLSALLDCLFRPFIDQRNSRGRNSYAAFLRQALQSSYAVEIRQRAMETTPATSELVSWIKALLPPMSASLQSHRIIAVNLLMLNMVALLDHDPPEGLAADLIYRDTLGMCTSAMMREPD